MKVLVTGASGLLGQEITKALAQRSHDVVAVGHREAEISDRDEVMSLVTAVRPDAVIHSAAWTNVEAAEQPENRESVYKTNVDGTKNIAEAAERIHARLLYISTDYVFDGTGTRPWVPDEKRLAPLNYYGWTKLEGEKAIRERLDMFFVVRTSWLFGSGGKNFIRTIIHTGKKQVAVRVVDDQIGTPTYAPDLADLLAEMVATEQYGFYHATNAETEPGAYISWYDLTKEVYSQIGCKTAVMPVSTADYGHSTAARPLNSRLDKSKLAEAGFRSLPDWKDAVRRYVRELE